MKIVLITTRMVDKWNKHTFNSQESLSTGYLAAYLEEYGYDVDVVNANTMNIDVDQIMDHIKNKEYDCYGISCISQKSYLETRNLAQKLRNAYSEKHIFIGGLYPTLEYENILKDIPIDTVILGEGEIPLLKLVESLESNNVSYKSTAGIAYMENGNVSVNKPQNCSNIASFPFPRRENIDFSKLADKRLYLVAGKGCYGSCAYCSLRSIDTLKKRVYRQASHVLDEIESLIKRFGINSFYFHDDIFYDQSPDSKNWLNEFHNGIINRQLDIQYRIYVRANDVLEEDIVMLKKSGLKQVYLGIESGVQRLLDEMNKKIKIEDGVRAIKILKDNKVSMDIGFITLIPTMTFEELKQNYDYLFNLGYYKVANLCDRLNIYSGCEYVDILGKRNLLLPQKYFWEKQEYLFSDPKVGIVHDILQEVKQALKPTTNLQDKIKEKLLANSEYSSYKQDDEHYLEFWANMIKLILKEVELDTQYNEIIQKLMGMIQKQYELTKFTYEERTQQLSLC